MNQFDGRLRAIIEIERFKNGEDETPMGRVQKKLAKLLKRAKR